MGTEDTLGDQARSDSDADDGVERVDPAQGASASPHAELSADAEPDADVQPDADGPADAQPDAMEILKETGDGVAGAAHAPTTRWGELVARGTALRPSLKALIAFLLFELVTIAIWARPVLFELGSRYIGEGGGDSKLYIWSLGWTPWALTHHSDLLHTTMIYAPKGISLAWVTFLPGAAFLAWPITKLFGPLAAYNVWLMLAPALAALGAYLVCHRITDRFWASLVGGYVFGFGTFLVGHMHGHLNLVLVFPVPLAVYVVVRRVQGSLGPVATVLWLTLILVGQFLFSTELFATATMYFVLAFACALIFGGRLRKRFLMTGLLVAGSYVLAAIVLSPYIRSALDHAPAAALRPTDRTVIDLYSLIIPRATTVFGTVPALLERSLRFPATSVEDAGYISVALLAVLIGFAITGRRRWSTWGLLTFWVLGTVLAFGAWLHIGGERTSIRLPGALLADMPLLKNATPQRFPVYTALALGLIVAIWLTRAGRRWWAPLAWTLALGGCFLLLARVNEPPFHPTEHLPAFFTGGDVGTVVRPGENVLVIPRDKGAEMHFQTAAGFPFRMPQGHVGPVPDQFQGNPLSRGLARVQPHPYMPAPASFAAWLEQNGVTAVIVDDIARPRFEPLVRSVGMEPVFEGGGVSVWRPEGGTYVVYDPWQVNVATRIDGQTRVFASFSMPSLDGSERIERGDYGATPMIMSFFDATCDCEQQLLELQAFHEANPGVPVLAVESFTGTDPPRDVVSELGLTYEVGLDPIGRVAQMFTFPGKPGTAAKRTGYTADGLDLPITIGVAANGRATLPRAGTLDQRALAKLATAVGA